MHGRIALIAGGHCDARARATTPRRSPNLDRAYELDQRFGDRDTQMLALVATGTRS